MSEDDVKAIAAAKAMMAALPDNWHFRSDGEARLIGFIEVLLADRERLIAVVTAARVLVAADDTMSLGLLEMQATDETVKALEDMKQALAALDAGAQEAG